MWTRRASERASWWSRTRRARRSSETRSAGRGIGLVPRRLGPTAEPQQTLHSAPSGHPSYRLLTALRLAHVLISKHGTISDWRDTLTGARELVSDDNERAVRVTLREICTALISRAEDAAEALEEVRLHAGREKEGWRVWAAGNVKALWNEEKAVAEAVAESVDAGVDF